ncbi:heme o synthase [Virgibacillus xinjiangensis]|uniref:Protoheme IX farnesyltransferase n=1 Tax=Virgibacillus xinjiangensis TaxID=393090 RepID=A0ABV7CUS9_9BACI
MDNVETTSSQLIKKEAVIEEPKTSIINEFKALIKVGIINSNLITAFAGFWLALYFTGSSITAMWDVFLLAMGGTAFVIAGGCILNNWYDVDIDPQMTRTKGRPTVTGSFSLHTVLFMGVTATIIGLVMLLFTTVEAAALGLFGWFSYVVLYTMWAKRRFTLNTVVGSISGAMPPLIGWTAVDPSFHVVPLTLFLIMFIWQTPHFLALAMKKVEDYRAAGVPMLPVVHGFEFTKRQIVVYIACLIPLPFLLSSLGTVFVVIATLLNLGWLFIGLRGFFMKDALKWANIIFIYSLNYLTVMFLMMILVTLPIIN